MKINNKYCKNISIVFGCIMIGIVLLIMLVGLFYTPYDFAEIDVANKLDFFSKEHLLGTDNLGRDILSRLMVGARISFIIGGSTVAIGLFFGGILGSIAGYFGGIADEIIEKLIDTQMAFPGVLIALMMIAVFGSNTINIIFALAIMSMPRFARITRSGFLKNKSLDYVKATRARGAGIFRIMFIHILPNLTSEIIVTCSLSFSSAVMSEAGLSYLGLGANPLMPSFGKMLSEAQNVILQAPWYVFIPAISITLLAMGFNLIADGCQQIETKGENNI
ncbi:MAG: ABC transporter permease [Oscillospiraceae bacterium]